MMISMEKHTKLVGVTFEQRQENIEFLKPGQRLYWKHTPENPYDKNAVLVCVDEAMVLELGHLNMNMARHTVERMKEGLKQEIFVSMVTGGVHPLSRGVNIIIKISEIDD